MLTIVHIINGLESGGAETTMFGLCTSDSANRHIVISLLDQGKYFQPLVERGIEVHCIDLKGKGFFLHKMWVLYRLLRKIKPDVVQTWMYHSDLIGGLIARLAGIKKVFWGVHNTVLTPQLSKRTTIIISRLCSWLSAIVPYKIICCAEKAREVHADLGYCRQKLYVVNNGYDVSRFAENAAAGQQVRDELGIKDNSLILGCVGRFDPNKDHENLLTALSILVGKGMNVKCLLVGNQMTQDNAILQNWITDRNLTDNVLLLGLRNDIPAIMNALDIHVLSSVAEAFPNVICEAMACGTPCITTDVGDAAIIVGDVGWVVAPANSTALANAIQQAALERQNTVLWQERKLAVRARIVNNFELKKMIAAYQSLWLTH